MHSNWPELIEANIIRGVKGGGVRTAEEIKELRRKNVNHVAQLGDDVIFPLGGGMMTDGSSMRCRIRVSKLLQEMKRNQSFFDSQPVELRSQLEANGIEIAGKMEFELVLLDDLNPSDELIDSLRKEKCLSRDLCRMGFAVAEKTTRVPIVVLLKEQP